MSPAPAGLFLLSDSVGVWEPVGSNLPYVLHFSPGCLARSGHFLVFVLSGAVLAHIVAPTPGFRTYCVVTLPGRRRIKGNAPAIPAIHTERTTGTNVTETKPKGDGTNDNECGRDTGQDAGQHMRLGWLPGDIRGGDTQGLALPAGLLGGASGPQHYARRHMR